MADLLVYARNPEAVGGGNQGPHSSCCIFALVSALKAPIKNKFGKDIAVQTIADAICMRGFTNPWGQLIIHHGTTVFDLVKKLNDSNFMFKCEDNEYISCNIVAFEYDTDHLLTKMVEPCNHSHMNIDGLTGLTGLTSRHLSEEACVVVASGLRSGGQHSRHALHGKYMCGRGDELKIQCENSWGSSEPNPQVPGTRWSKIDAYVMLTIV